MTMKETATEKLNLFLSFCNEKQKRIAGISFLILILFQLAFATGFIIRSEIILNNGAIFYFETQPIDPKDPLRGKYITLNFKEDSFDDLYATREPGETVFVTFRKNEDGYAVIDKVTRSHPKTPLFLRTTVIGKIRWGEKEGKTRIEYPFNQFFMEESKAEIAQRLARTRGTTYAKVRIKDGSAVIEDVLISGESIKDVVEKNR